MTFIIEQATAVGGGVEWHGTAGAGMDEDAQQPEDFATVFESAFARLQVVLEMACAGGEMVWPERAAVAIRRAFELAAADPVAVGALTSEALARGVDGVERYERLMAYVAGLLEGGRAGSPHGAELPPTTERSLAGGVATIVANRVDRGRARELPSLVPEVVQFVLTPYLGTAEARRIAAMSADWPSSQPER
jgi:hypothetical protein